MGMGEGTDVYQDLDAMGNFVRNWTKSGSNFVRTDYLYDVRGLKIKSAYPVSGQPSHNSSCSHSLSIRSSICITTTALETNGKPTPTTAPELGMSISKNLRRE